MLQKISTTFWRKKQICFSSLRSERPLQHFWWLLLRVNPERTEDWMQTKQDMRNSSLCFQNACMTMGCDNFNIQEKKQRDEIFQDMRFIPSSARVSMYVCVSLWSTQSTRVPTKNLTRTCLRHICTDVIKNRNRKFKGFFYGEFWSKCCNSLHCLRF